MATEVIMPALGMAQETGRLLRWIKREGDQVAAGELLMEIETDKSAVEIEATASGVLQGVRVHEGDEVAVGTSLAWILGPAESVPGLGAGAGAMAPPSLAPSPTASPGAAGARSEVQPKGRVAASPRARRQAGERGLVLVPGGGSGPGGAYLAADIGAGPDRARRGTAASTTAVWTTTPHFYLSREVRAGALQQRLERLRQGLGVRLTYTDLLLAALAQTLAAHPRINDHWDAGQVRHRATGHLALAVAGPKGLLMVTLTEPGRLGVAELAEARRQAVARARAGRLLASDLEPASVTLSNLGMFGVDRFEAVLAEGQSCLLAVGRIREAAVAVSGRPAVEP
ncbi:MAG: 2-oxo acid dehydrogenase subunit E2, partial [Candidatus Dormibacteria bacterium]